MQGFINTNLLEKMNIIASANIQLTEAELKDIARDCMKSKSDFCCRKLLDIAKKSNFKMTLPNEFAANQVIDQIHNQIKEIIQKYDGTTQHDNLTTAESVPDLHEHTESDRTGSIQEGSDGLYRFPQKMRRCF